MNENFKDQHYGQIIEKVIRRNGYSISELARLTDVNRRSVYNWFNQKYLKPAIIHKIGMALKHDFSNEFPELFMKAEQRGVSHLPDDAVYAEEEGEGRARSEQYWKDKYIDLLEKHNQLLLAYVEKSSLYS
ncbi:helix-turn-helix domain-containing protein [Arcticibacter sp.]|jgi:lambda repressor-like predicted transcriptional regulator|uniref:helix-turn-helix domain-containing protein n=1 Tax=Arcticibacter sp. TaxID=1872630 RepID=UPI003890E400